MTRFQFQAGDRPLDGYTIEYALGRGGFGEVYYAVSDAGRQVALKAVQNYEEIELRGISHCMNLKSQHLVAIFDVRKSAEGLPWVIMEFVSGPSLRDILDESPTGLGPEKSSFFIHELAKGLSYLHGAGVVHRDLKPHNVFFEDGVVKIGDYSLSKVITSSHRSGHTMTVGTVHYMAPEISMGRYDKTVDVYALGVMLYEMLTGSPPYVGDSMGEVLMKHLSSKPDVSMIAEPFASVISKAMQRDPADRYQSAEEMAAAVQGVSTSNLEMTGFGPASLSIVADRAANRPRRFGDDSTEPVDAALTGTQPGSFRNSDEVHPMRQVGHDIGRFAIHTAIAGEVAGPLRATVVADPIPPLGRFFLATITLCLISIGGGWMADSFFDNPGWGSAGPPFVSEQTRVISLMLWGPLNNSIAIGAWIFGVAASLSIAALGVRNLIHRGILPPRPKRTRMANFLIWMVTLGLMLLIGIVPITSILMVDVFVISVTLMIQNWALLTSRSRLSRIRFAPVLFAACLTFLVAEIVSTGSIRCVAAVIGASLSIQVWAAFDPQKTHLQGSVSKDAAFAETTASPAASSAPIQSLATVQ